MTRSELIVKYREKLSEYNNKMEEYSKISFEIDTQYDAILKKSNFWKIQFIIDYVWTNALIIFIFIYQYLKSSINDYIVLYIFFFALINASITIALIVNRHKYKINKTTRDYIIRKNNERYKDACVYLEETALLGMDFILFSCLGENDFSYENKRNEMKQKIYREIKERYPNQGTYTSVIEYTNALIKTQNYETSNEQTHFEKRMIVNAKERLY